MLTTTRTLGALLVLGATAALGAASPTAAAAPASGSAGGSSAAGCGPRTDADMIFLSRSHFDEESCSVQDAAIRLARTDCRWLDAHGGSAHNRIALAEDHRGTVEYPYTFVAAAVDAYCPQHRR